MENRPEEDRGTDLPACANAFIRRVVRRMWYRRRARREVRAELTAHFEDALRDCATAQERERRAQGLIEGFGDARLLAALCHRAKKHCRPLWLKVLLRSGQGLGIVVLYYVLCMLPPLLGRPTIRVNYAEWLSTRWRPQGQEAENAKVYYDQAASAYVKPPAGLEERMRLRRWGSYGYSASDVQAIEQWLTQNHAAFSVLRQGAATPHYWPAYDGNDATPPLMSINENDMAALGHWRHLTFAFKQQIIWEIRRGELTQALDDCLVLRRFGRHAQNKGTLNGQMVGISIETMGYDGIVTVLQAKEVPPQALEHAQQEVMSGFDPARQVVDLACERTFWYDQIQRTFTDDGKGGGHALSRGFVYASGTWKDNLLNLFRFRYPDRRETVAMVDRYFQQAQRQLNTLPAAQHQAEPNEPAQASALNIMLSLVTPAYERVAQQAWRLKTHEVGILTLLALQRFFRANGSYPDSLSQLVERGFLEEMPRDPFGSGPLTYRRTDNGFLLYGWGEDRKDDGGQLGTDSQGQPRNWAANGDWVFWPVPEL